MSKLKKYSLFLSLIFSIGTANAQYYSWGASPASVRWKKLATPKVKLLYPADFEENAFRVMWYLDTVRTHLGFGFRHGTMKTPVVIHNRNMTGNGMVMWTPKRVELLAAPGASYSEPWLKQLAFHEYRHNVQYNNLRRGTNRVLSWFLGEQINFLGVGQFSIYILEGDATMAETELSAFGRGLQPSFTMHYRAVRDAGFGVGSDGRAGDYWFCGSLRDHVPDHYRLGYQMARWSYNHFGGFIWDDMARYVAHNPQFIVPMTIGLKKQYGLSQSELFRRTFADLNAYWDSLPREEDTSVRIETQWTSYTTYRWPLWLEGGGLAAFKSDLDRYNRIVRVDVSTGLEEVLAYTGVVSSRPALAEGRLWWTEYRQSVLWEEKVNSRLCSYDLATGRKRVYGGGEQIFYPTPLPDGEIARVGYDYSGRFSVITDGGRVDFPLDVEISGLAWDDATEALYFTGLDDGGMFLGKVGEGGWHRLTPSRHITISDLRAGGGRLYFGSIASGKDEAHCYELATGVEYRLTESAYGAFQPSIPAAGSVAGGDRIALTIYDRHGYHLAVQDASGTVEQPVRELPVDLVNPPWKRWDVPPMDSLVYTSAERERSLAQLRPAKYRKGLNLFHPHSWLPLGFYPPAAIREKDLAMTPGATVMSQSLLSDATSWFSYGWDRRGGSMLRGGLSYSGLGAVLDVDFTWGGGSQLLYTRIPDWLDVGLRKYFDVNTRLSLPMTISSGYWWSALTPYAEYYYTNGLIFTPIDRTKNKLVRGVDKLTFSVMYSGQIRMAAKEFLPRWGIAARAGFVMNPTNSDFHNLYTVFLRGYLPGVVRPHSTTLRMAWQQAGGRQRALYAFRAKEVFPRGARYDFAARRWASGSVDYQFPVWYPERGIPGVVYFKRVRLNVFADCARWQAFDGQWQPLFSYGGDVILDISPLRMPATTRVSAKFTLAKPSDRRGLFFNFGLEVPL